MNVNIVYRRDQRGFSLIEVMVGLLVAAVLAAGILSAQGFGTMTLRHSRDLVNSTHTLQEAYEYIQGVSFATVDGWGIFTNQSFSTKAGQTPTSLSALADGSLLMSIGGYDADGDGSVEMGTGADDDDMRLLTLALSFTGYDGSTHTREISTLVMNND